MPEVIDDVIKNQLMETVEAGTLTLGARLQLGYDHNLEYMVNRIQDPILREAVGLALEGQRLVGRSEGMEFILSGTALPETNHVRMVREVRNRR